jgi:hypothetical protein
MWSSRGSQLTVEFGDWVKIVRTNSGPSADMV